MIKNNTDTERFSNLVANFDNIKILIVDDIPHNLQILGNILKENELSFAFATDGKKGLSTAMKILPDLILLDVNMPEMDGFEVAANLQHNPQTKNIPIIFLTARTETEDLVEGFNAGGVDYLTKPFNKTELIMRVRNHLEAKFARDKIARQNQELIEKQQEIARTAQEVLLLNEQLEDSEARLKQLNDSKDRFFSIIAHDLKNPLAGLNLAIEILINYYDKMSEDEIKKNISALSKSAGASFQLLDNLLEWSRSQTGTVEFRPQNCKLNDLMQNSIDLLAQNAENKGITLNVSIPEELYAYCDNNLISTVVRNLVSNAIKFTPEGGSIAIAVEEHDSCVKVFVADTGIGIATEDIEKLFRIGISHTTIGTSKEKGTGLGLILCKEYLLKHGRDIKVDSKLGEGTTFYFELDKASAELPTP